MNSFAFDPTPLVDCHAASPRLAAPTGYARQVHLGRFIATGDWMSWLVETDPAGDVRYYLLHASDAREVAFAHADAVLVAAAANNFRAAAAA